MLRKSPARKVAGDGPLAQAVARCRRATARTNCVHKTLHLCTQKLSPLDRDDAKHARDAGFRAHGKSPIAKRCRYPLRIQPELSVGADAQLPHVAVSLMKQVVDIDMI